MASVGSPNLYFVSNDQRDVSQATAQLACNQSACHSHLHQQVQDAGLENRSNASGSDALGP
jgi:hypothetical protein